MRIINTEGLNLLKKFEGCAPVPYKDIGGVLTVGYGHTGSDVVEGVVWTQAAIDNTLEKDLEKFYQIDHYVSEQVNDNQYSALVCLAFNVGLKAVKLSQTLKLVNSGESPDKEWLGFCKVNGVTSQGLLNRRKAELELYHALFYTGPGSGDTDDFNAK